MVYGLWGLLKIARKADKLPSPNHCESRDFLLVFKNLSHSNCPARREPKALASLNSTDVAGSPPRTSRSVRAMGDAPPHEQNEKLACGE